MLGKGMRKNTLVKIADKSLTQTGLSDESTFNYITYQDIHTFFKNSIVNDVTGVYNAVSNTNISLKEISDHFNHYPKYGDFVYDTPDIINNIPNHISDIGTKSSLEIIKRFTKEND